MNSRQGKNWVFEWWRLIVFWTIALPSRLMIPCWHLCVLELLPGTSNNLNCSSPWTSDPLSLFHFCCVVLNKSTHVCVSCHKGEAEHSSVLLLMLDENTDSWQIHTPQIYLEMWLRAVHGLESHVQVSLTPLCGQKSRYAFPSFLLPAEENLWNLEWWLSVEMTAVERCRAVCESGDLKGLHSLMYCLPLPLWMHFQMLLRVFFLFLLFSFSSWLLFPFSPFLSFLLMPVGAHQLTDLTGISLQSRLCCFISSTNPPSMQLPLFLYW